MANNSKAGTIWLQKQGTVNFGFSEDNDDIPLASDASVNAFMNKAALPALSESSEPSTDEPECTVWDAKLENVAPSSINLRGRDYLIEMSKLMLITKSTTGVDWKLGSNEFSSWKTMSRQGIVVPLKPALEAIRAGTHTSTSVFDAGCELHTLLYENGRPIASSALLDSLLVRKAPAEADASAPAVPVATKKRPREPSETAASTEKPAEKSAEKSADKVAEKAPEKKRPREESKTQTSTPVLPQEAMPEEEAPALLYDDAQDTASAVVAMFLQLKPDAVKYTLSDQADMSAFTKPFETALIALIDTTKDKHAIDLLCAVSIRLLSTLTDEMKSTSKLHRKLLQLSSIEPVLPRYSGIIAKFLHHHADMQRVLAKFKETYGAAAKFENEVQIVIKKI